MDLDIEYVRDAFTLDVENAECNVEIKPANDCLKIRGNVVKGNETIAQYGRTIAQGTNALYASHDSIWIGTNYRGLGIARTLISQSLQLYDSVGVTHIDLIAADEGTTVWPRYAWSPVDLSERSEEQGIHLVHERIRWHITKVTSLDDDEELPTFGPDILGLILKNRNGVFFLEIGEIQRPSGNSAYVGVEALAELGRDEVLVPMRLDLTDERTRSFLIGRGLMSVTQESDRLEERP